MVRVRNLIWVWLGLGGCDSLVELAEPEPSRNSDEEKKRDKEDDGPVQAEAGGSEGPKITESGLATSPPAGADIDCEAALESHSGAACAAQELSCGSIVSARVGEGSSRFSDDFYVAKQCGPQRNEYTGPESIYALSIPPDTRAAVFLESPCADLDLSSVLWAETDRCPTVDHRTGGCEMDQGSGTDRVVIATVTRAETHLLIVDGKLGAKSNYRLSVVCDAYR
jgi:hypothetical protein